MARFDESSGRQRLDFFLTAGADPAENLTLTQSPTPIPTESALPTALNPDADIDGSGRIDQTDLLGVLNNWYRIIE